MKKIFWALIVLILSLGLLYILGPKAEFVMVNPDPVSVNVPLNDLDDYIAQQESKVSDIKPDNEARIVWLDSTKQKTEYALVYLHGFSASQEEGDPIHTNFAQRYGMNLYLPRIAGHGRLDSNSFINLTPEAMLASAKEAISIGKKIGEKVVLMSCSTGSTYSVYLTAHDPSIHSQIMYSPNIDLHDPMSDLTTGPWGSWMLEKVLGDERNHISYTPEAQKYWNPTYHKNGIIAVKALIEQTMNTEVFEKINQPMFIGYFYKDENAFDDVVSIPEMKRLIKEISTEEDKKRIEAFPDVHSHVIASRVMSKDVASVQNSTFKFAEEVLGFKPISADVPE